MRAALWPADHRAEIAEWFANPSFAVFVAERDGGALGGFVEVGERAYAEGCDSSPVAFLEGWYVDEDLRGSGVAAALVRAAEEWARAHGHTEMASDTELTNDRAIAAHRRLGYDEVERLVCFRRDL